MSASSRREFLGLVATAAATVVLPGCASIAAASRRSVAGLAVDGCRARHCRYFEPDARLPDGVGRCTLGSHR